MLKIQAMDYDDLFGDDLIGETNIDLEDRFFSPEWQAIKNKPVEYRQLYHPSTKISQGVVKLWVEIHPAELKKDEVLHWNIEPRPPTDFEVRVVVWDTKDVKSEDWEGTSDIFVRSFFKPNNAKETDCHYRCQNGKGSFNWRMLFDVKYPDDNTTLSLQVWDRDLFKSNDFIGDASFNLKLLFIDAVETGKPIALSKKYYDGYLREKMGPDAKLEFEDDQSFWVPAKDKEVFSF